MAEALVTIAVVPHERFSVAPRSLLSVIEHAPPGTPLVYIDGGSPHLVRQFLERQAVRQGFRLISTERLVAPNTARNLALAQVTTRYVAFVDNDLIVSRDWLRTLVDCAEATGADVVVPRCQTEAAPVVCPQVMAPVLKVELRAALIRRSLFEQLGPFDEQLLGTADELDWRLRVQQHRGRIYREPHSLVTYQPPPPFDAGDLPYFELRWSEAWKDASLAYFRQKWNRTEADVELAALERAGAAHRRLLWEPYRRMLRLMGSRGAAWIEETLLAPLESLANRRRVRRLSHPGEPHRKAA